MDSPMDSPDNIMFDTRIEIFRDTGNLKLKKSDITVARLATVFKASVSH